jgi:isopenicillin N synthase-like dioxygenase
MTDYQSIPETTANLEWASLVTLDLSEFDRPGGKEKLASQLKDAIHKIGFFYIVNHGISKEDFNQQFELAPQIFSLPHEEKMKCAVNGTLPGGPLGYKPPGKRSVELYDDPKYNALFKGRARPAPCEVSKEQNERVCRHIHNHILYRLLVLVGIIMEYEDEEALWKIHNYDDMSNCHMRYMVHWPPTQEQLEHEIRSGEVISGHSDFGTFTFLFRQPVAALQVRLEEEKEWKWVKPVQDSITVNVAVSIENRRRAVLTVKTGYLEFSYWRIFEEQYPQSRTSTRGSKTSSETQRHLLLTTW